MTAETIHRKTKVVIIDDDPTYLKVWEKVFRKMDCCHFCLTNDPEMVKSLGKDCDIDLLISEVIMDKGSGFELAEAVHKNNPKANIVLTTTYNCDLKRFDLNEPRFHILYKPYHSIDDVIQFVANILHDQNPCNELDEDSWSENEDFPAIVEWKL